MGNRAVIALGRNASVGIYLHWNGGHESVKAFLDATRTLTASRGPDAQYRSARLIQVIGNFLGGSMSLGIGPMSTLDTDNGDNGTYIINPATLEIVAREHVPGHAQAQPWQQAYYEGVLAGVIEKNSEVFAKD